MKKMKLLLSVCLILLCASTLFAKVYYPDTQTPGTAAGQYQNNHGILENDVITFSFDYQSGVLQNMVVEHNNKVIRDGITMIYPFKDTPFPSGIIDLPGRDW